MATITLTATAASGYGGKQYLARITGRDSKFILYELIGRKSGKRDEYDEAVIDTPGLYLICDIDCKGRTRETFLLFDGERHVSLSVEEALALAQKINHATQYAEEVRLSRLATQKRVQAESLSRDPDDVITFTSDVGDLPEGSYSRRDVNEARARLIAELEGGTTADADEPPPGIPAGDWAQTPERVKALIRRLGAEVDA